MAMSLTLSPAEKAELDKLEAKLSHVRDAVKGVVKHYHTGLFLHGEGGTGKSYTVWNQLQALKCTYVYNNSRITGRGLVESLQESPSSVHFLEDAETMLDDKKSFGVLRSALWSQSKKRPPERVITWKAFHTNIRFIFTGGIIVISNANLADTIPEIRAIKTRINVLSMDISNNEILALMHKICIEGHRLGELYLAPVNCVRVMEFVIEKLTDLNKKLDIRLLVNGFHDYLQWKNGHSENDWKVLLEGRMMERVTYRDRASMNAEKRSVAMSLYVDKSMTVAQKNKEWIKRTGLTQAAYYRALKR